MHLHEYQAKRFLQGFTIPLSEFCVVATPEELQALLQEKKWEEVILKVQIHAGGRGKAGGVQKAKGMEQSLQQANKMLGMHIVNQQTGPEGVIARQLLVAPLVSVEKEYYLGITIDRSKGVAVLIASAEGGMEIEEIAAKNPEKILRLPIAWQRKLRSYQKFALAKQMQWQGAVAEEGIALTQSLINAFFAADATLLEINPLALTTEGHLEVLDAKLSVDDNALFRHPQFAAWEDFTQIPEQEAHAKKYDLAYVSLDGQIGCIVNGAGLAMATMDSILYYGGKPANFLDVGGGASQEKITEGFKIVLSDPKVKAILVNIFGGIMNCATLARGMLSAFQELCLQVPLIVRMEGTNVEEGKALLEGANLSILAVDNLDQAAQLAVEKAV